MRRCRSAIAVESEGASTLRSVALLTCAEHASIAACMSEIEDKEDRLIRKILIAVPTVAVLGFLATVLLITVMVSCNFNILDWLE